VKWDDQPMSLQHFAESAVRAYGIAMTSPRGPVMLVCDSELQEAEIRRPEALRIPKAILPAQPQGDTVAVWEAARLLAAAEKPLIIADRACRSQQGVRMMVELAETLGAPVVDIGCRVNFPATHELNLSFTHWNRIRDADVFLLLEADFPWSNANAVNESGDAARPTANSPSAKIVTISMREVYLKSNYQDFQRFQPADIGISGDVETTLPGLLEALKRSIPAERRAEIARRSAAIAGMHREMTRRDMEAAQRGWDACPITPARLAAALWDTVKHEKWSLVVSQRNGWPRRLWPITEYHQMLGGSGGSGIGYAAGGALGAALANREHGIVSVTIQSDGDLLYVPGALWTAAHHKIPLLYVMFNNRCYLQTKVHLQVIAAQRNRSRDTARIGNEITDPDIDFARLAQSMGMWAEGPIIDPGKLAPALKRALAKVKDGRPALVDVVCQC
jgi:thiamine pyrophosphate-dependent acetolactate synthase large subunit-like protein